MIGRFARFVFGAVSVLACANEGCGSEDPNNGCGSDCKQTCSSALPLGVIGSYTSLAKAPDGKLWVAGYNDAASSLDGSFLWGDLVVGTLDTGTGEIAWQTVDGIPGRTDGTCPRSDRSGWRGGEEDSGDDVGLWTSIQVDPQRGKPMVAYYDVTHRRLKFAYEDEGWKSYALTDEKPGVVAGRYAKMIFVGGNPVIALSESEPGSGGKKRSKVVLAKASSPLPRQASDWSFEDLLVDEEGPCTPMTCGADEACVDSTRICAKKVGGCQPTDCGSGSACVAVAGKATCEAIVDRDLVAYPTEVGDYLSVALGPNGIGIVSYDRIHGNLVGLSNAKGKWTATLLDGETGSRKDNTAVDTGDVGVGSSLFIDPNGNWHVTYVNGLRETLQYLLVNTGSTARTPEIIDDGFGLGVGATPFADGRHLIGDDSQVRILADGSVEVLYQDATAGTLRFARGTPKGASHEWKIVVLQQTGKFAGFFPHWVPDTRSATNFWRSADRGAQSIAGNVALAPLP